MIKPDEKLTPITNHIYGSILDEDEFIPGSSIIIAPGSFMHSGRPTVSEDGVRGYTTRDTDSTLRVKVLKVGADVEYVTPGQIVHIWRDRVLDKGWTDGEYILFDDSPYFMIGICEPSEES